MWGASLPKPISPLTPERRRLRPPAGRWCAIGSRWPATASSTTPCTWSPPLRPGRTLGAAPTTARRSRRANLAKRRYGASKGASPMPSSGAFWRIRRQPRAAPLDKEEPRMPIPRDRVNSLKSRSQCGWEELAELTDKAEALEARYTRLYDALGAEVSERYNRLYAQTSP